MEGVIQIIGDTLGGRGGVRKIPKSDTYYLNESHVKVEEKQKVNDLNFLDGVCNEKHIATKLLRDVHDLAGCAQRLDTLPNTETY